MKNTKFNFHKFSVITFALTLLAGQVFALPNVKVYTPDSSGEFVYYRDKTFTTDSVVGFAYYSEDTYGARYYAPENAETKSIPKDISIYFNIDSANGRLEFTGENIFGSDGSQEDADIVNYLHDLFFEFAERRQKQNLSTSQAVKIKTEIPQFGGDVTVTYNNLIPIFNLEKISVPDGTVVFEVETVGCLSSSQDTSFSSYKGLEGMPKDKARTFKKKSAKASTATFSTPSGKQSVKLDAQWEKASENMWLLGDNALLTMSAVECPDFLKDSPDQYKTLLARKLGEGSDFTYSMWKHRSVSEKNGQVTITTLYNNSTNGDVTRDFKIMTFAKDGSCNLLSLTVFDNIYQNNKSYFTKILKSLSVEENK